MASCGCVWHCVVVFGIVWLCQSAGYETHFTAEFKEGLFAATSKTGIRRWKVTINTDGFIHSNAPSKLKNIYVHYKNKWLRGMLARFRLRASGK